MCDTFYAGAGACAGGRSWFAKNSDRNPAEPQALCLVGRRESAASVTVGGRVLPLADRGLAYLLSKPSWMEGGEMGVNERGVAIGNEAVFSVFPAAKGGILGMDLLRAALASSETAAEAVESICAFTESRDQGGNGAYKGSLYYCNSYLVADPSGAYVVETAGRRWAWRRAEGLAAISNAYSIGTDYERLDAVTRREIAPEAEGPGGAGRRSWRGRVEDRLRLFFTKGDARRGAVLQALGAAGGAVDFGHVLAALRSHGSFDPARPRRGHMTSVCMHSGGLLNNASTASMVVEYLPSAADRGRALVWFTGTSYPCLSIFKPVLLSRGAFEPLWTEYDYGEGAAPAYEFWEAQRAWIEGAGAGGLGLEPAFAARRDAVQGRIVEAARAALAGSSLGEARREIDAAAREWRAGLGRP